jgi:rfaE bifunctional protein kinase chain/domain
MSTGDLIARLEMLIRGFSGTRVLVLADLVADEFVHGQVARVSREAPVLILEHERSEVRLGGGANAVNNILGLGARPFPLGVVGADLQGQRLRALLRDGGVTTAGVRTQRGYATPVKSRVLAGGAHSTKQQIVRIDHLQSLPRVSAARDEALRILTADGSRVDGILVSDYGLGFVTPKLVRAAVRLARRRHIPITIDSRYDLLRYKGMTAVTPNEPEVEAALGITIGQDRRRLEAAGVDLLERLRAQAVLITRGSDGMALFRAGSAPLHLPVSGGDQVADVTGAGDTVIATFTLALAAGATLEDAARVANHAGGVVVMKRGTATVSPTELLRAVRAHS